MSSATGDEEQKDDYPTGAEVDPSGMNIQMVGPIGDGRNSWIVCSNKFEIDE